MSNQKEISTLVKIGYTIMLSVPIICVALIISVSPDMFSDYSSPYYSVCLELAWNINGLSPNECIQYMEVNPGATGQDVIEHDIEQDIEEDITRSPKLEELLNNPIEPLT